MAAGIEDKIAALETKLKQAKAERQKIESRKRAAEAKTKRADDTRRKILAGALVLEMMENDDATKQRFLERLNKYLTRNDDRALFGLLPLPEKPEDQGDEASSNQPKKNMVGEALAAING